MKYYEGEWQVITEKPLPVYPLERIEIMAIDDNENIWCGTANGHYMFDGEDWHSYVTNDHILKVE